MHLTLLATFQDGGGTYGGGPFAFLLLFGALAALVALTYLVLIWRERRQKQRSRKMTEAPGPIGPGASLPSGLPLLAAKGNDWV
jgi:uncharacterized iron-regulated membrane protein